MNRPSGLAWVVGGGTGIGRATAIALATAGAEVVVSGRRVAQLDATVKLVRSVGGKCSSVVLDVSDPVDVVTKHAQIEARFGVVGTLVYCAGTNTVTRFWSDVETTDIASVLDVNLQGAVRTVHAVLPGMRGRAGLIVLVSSWAAWRYSPGAGAAYSMSKTALGVLAETLNAEEHANQIRATHLCPGEVVTDILDTRPVPPSPAERARMLAPDDVGEAIAWIASRPARVCVNEIVITPSANTSYQPALGATVADDLPRTTHVRSKKETKK